MLGYTSGSTPGGLSHRGDPADGRGEEVSCGAMPEETARQGRRWALWRDDAGRTTEGSRRSGILVGLVPSTLRGSGHQFHEDTGERVLRKLRSLRELYALFADLPPLSRTTSRRRIYQLADLRLLTHIKTKRAITEGNQQFVGAG